MSTISDKDYQFICDLVYEYSRINLGDNKKELVTARLGKRLRALNLVAYSDYCKLLQTSEGEEELTHLVDSISTNHTHFFREEKHFDFMRDVALPDWCSQLEKKGQKKLLIWSAASSSGEEPFSLAILLAEYFSTKSGWDWRIDATDISTKILKKAESAVYSEDRIAQVRPELQRKYFQKGVGKWDGFFRVKEALRARVRFINLNLLQPSYPFNEKFQIIFCRNVMIYFDRTTQEQLVAKLTDQLYPGGYLMIGHSESLTGINHRLKTLKPAIYQKSAI